MTCQGGQSGGKRVFEQKVPASPSSKQIEMPPAMMMRTVEAE